MFYYLSNIIIFNDCTFDIDIQYKMHFNYIAGVKAMAKLVLDILILTHHCTLV